MNTINGNSYASSRGPMKTAVWGPMTGALFGSAPTLASHAQHFAVPATFDALIGHLSSRTMPLLRVVTPALVVIETRVRIPLGPPR